MDGVEAGVRRASARTGNLDGLVVDTVHPVDESEDLEVADREAELLLDGQHCAVPARE